MPWVARGRARRKNYAMKTNSRKLAYATEPTAYLVAGRAFFGDLGEAEFDRLCSGVDELAQRLGQPLVVLPEGDRTETGVPIAGNHMGYVLGLLADHALTYTQRVDHEKLRAAVAAAGELPWPDLVKLAPQTDDIIARLAQEPALYLTACGPLAGGMMGYGVVTDLECYWDDGYWHEEDETRFRVEEDGLAAQVSGLDLVRGNDTEQVPQAEAVYGVWVAKALWDMNLPVSVDISPTAHRERVAKLGSLADRAGYYLIGHFD